MPKGTFTAVFVVSLAVLCPPEVSAQVPIPDTAASRYIGQTVTVEGLVVSVHTSRAGNAFLNFGAAYPNQVFSVVIFRAAAARFGDLHRWEGKRVRVTGRIQLYQGKPEIILRDPEAIAVAP
ncbi:MAG TPA: hypothetical protein VKP10_15635 [Gemmatimonadales bacterium]|nr:hypothetical protein [Gemmatimonadales bacterium]